MNNLHWAVTASDERIKQATGGYVYHLAVDIQIKHLKNEKEAIQKAKEIIKRKYYFLRSVIECECASHSLQHRKTLEVNKDLVKTMKKQLGNNDDE